MRQPTLRRASLGAGTFVLTLVFATAPGAAIFAQDTEHANQLEYMVEMRDGVKLATTV